MKEKFPSRLIEQNETVKW